MLKKVIFSCVICLCVTSSAQYLNRESKAIIEINLKEGVFEITAKAENLSQTKQSLSYEVKVFKENLETGNKSSNVQEGRFVIDPLNVMKLAFTAINIQDKNDKIVLLLLLRNIDNEIVGKSRKVIIDNKVIQDKSMTILKEKPNDGIKITGMVLEKINMAA